MCLPSLTSRLIQLCSICIVMHKYGFLETKQTPRWLRSRGWQATAGRGYTCMKVSESPASKTSWLRRASLWLCITCSTAKAYMTRNGTLLIIESSPLFKPLDSPAYDLNPAGTPRVAHFCRSHGTYDNLRARLHSTRTPHGFSRVQRAATLTYKRSSVALWQIPDTSTPRVVHALRCADH